MLVTGGAAGLGTDVTAVQIYDPVAGTWTSGPALTPAREGHTATALANGKVLVAGGSCGGGDCPSQVFDPTEGSWTTAAVGTQAQLQRNAPALRLQDGRVLIVGGISSDLTAATLYLPGVPY